MRRSVIISSVFLLAAGLIQFACVQDFDQFDPGAPTGGVAGSGGETSSSSGIAGAGGASSSSSSTSSSSTSASSSSTASSASSSSSSTGGMPCNNSGDCPNDTDCINWFCMMGTGMCGQMFRPQGMVVNDPTNGDCQAEVCDGNGNVVTGEDNNDTPPGDNNSCTNESCNNGVPMTTNDPVGTSCNNGNHCNNVGMCVDCIVDGDCNTGTNPSCFQENCISCSDGMKNGDEEDVDCGGTKCTKKCAGAMCADGMECKSNFCADSVCCDTACDTTCKSCNLAATKGICTNIPLNGTDNAPMCDGTEVCNGSGLCKLKDGETCANNMDCASNKCEGTPKVCAP